MAPGMKKCPLCLEMIPSDSSFCGYCKTDLRQPFPVNAAPVKASDGCLNRMIQVVGVIFLILFAIGFIAGIMGGGSRKKRDEGRRKACYANMRVLMGATEMYNMDHPQNLKTLDYEKLMQENLIKSIPQCPIPENHYFLKPLENNNYEIRCEGKAGHGTVE